MHERSRSDGATILVAGEAGDTPEVIRGKLGGPGTAAPFRVALDDGMPKTTGAPLDALAVFSPMALRRYGSDLSPGGTLILDSAGFTPAALSAAGYERDPRNALRRAGFRLISINVSALAEGVCHAGPGSAGLHRTLWTLGLLLALHEHDTAASEAWVAARIGGEQAALDALRAGHAFAGTARLAPVWHDRSRDAEPFSPGTWRKVDGARALAFGLAAGAQDLGLDPLLAACASGPGGDLLAAMNDLGPAAGVRCLDADDAGAAMAAALGASFAGAIGIAATFGADTVRAGGALGLAVACELPLVSVCVQRPGPASGLPAGTAQADLFWALHGRTGDCPCPVIAVRSPAHAFSAAREAVRLAVAHMTPVILLCDALAFEGTEAFRIPDLPPASPRTPAQTLSGAVQPFARDPRTLARPWAVPGTPGAAHRTGGLEQQDADGTLLNDPDNHARVTALRQDKLTLIGEREPEADLVSGTGDGEILLVGWGASFAAIADAAAGLRAAGLDVAHLHLDLLVPLPRGLTALVASFRHVLVAEMNAGQMLHVLRAATLVDAHPVTRTDGRPFCAQDIEMAVWSQVKGDAA
ncbi:2-oxoacid:acceptor oxidoreductase family protein [Stappia stellulata]|uniref:2-oxoacid:acceptor oxidoreductase family protein n=1 Tax=Stappia stellulata TaxID=71235 RepID=UPI000684E492|nr:2-oxoacid:acceptor oxidoreductase family protein [Stappia stellulata]